VRNTAFKRDMHGGLFGEGCGIEINPVGRGQWWCWAGFL